MCRLKEGGNVFIVEVRTGFLNGYNIVNSRLLIKVKSWDTIHLSM